MDMQNINCTQTRYIIYGGYVMKKTFLVNGMSCGHCKSMVENGLNAVNGVEIAEVNLEEKSVTIAMDDSVSTDIIKQTIESVGFDFMGEKK